MSSQSLARRARRSTTSRTFISVSGSARARATSTHSNCFRLAVLPALPRHPRRRPHLFRSPRPRRRWLRALPLRRLRPLPLHLPPSPLPHSHRPPPRHPRPVAAPRTSSGGLADWLVGAGGEGDRTQQAERGAPSWRSTCAPDTAGLTRGTHATQACRRECSRCRGRAPVDAECGALGAGRRDMDVVASTIRDGRSAPPVLT